MAAPKVLIPFYSRTGTIERLARAVAEGAEAELAVARFQGKRVTQVAEELFAS